MKVCIIRPSVLHKEVAFSHMPTPPLGPAYIAAVLRNAGHHVNVIDAAIEGFNKVEKFIFNTYIYGLNAAQTIDLIDEDVDIICFSFMFTNNWYLDKEFVIEAKKRFPDAKLIAGGEHATAVPKYCFETAPGLDFIVLGEGEDTIIDLFESLEGRQKIEEVSRIAYLKNGEFILNNFSRRIKRIRDINKIPWPAWDLFPLKKYFDYKVTYGVYRGNSLPILASRGCPYDCTFCSNPLMWGKNYELRDIEDLVDEMEYYLKNYNVTNFDFYDLTAIIYKDWIVKLCDEIIRRKLNITYQIPAGTRSEAIDKGVAEKLYLSGCKNITYAPESGSEKVLKDIKKRVKLNNMYDSIKYSCKAGMNIKLNMMVGFPDETHKDVWDTIWFLWKASWYGANDMYPAVFSPYPGSVLYDRLVKEGKIDLYSDDYIIEIINSHDLWPGKVYSSQMRSNTVKVYTIIMYFVFYGSNFIFRPIRLYKLIRNLLLNKHESRSELVISQTLYKLISTKKNDKTQSSKSPLYTYKHNINE